MKVIALRGKANTGKSTSLKILIRLFNKNKYRCVECAALSPYSKSDSREKIEEARNCIEKSLLLESDIYAVFYVNDKYIGITTQGDHATYLNDSLSKINKVIINAGIRNDKYNVFICSIRTYGNTYNFLFDNFQNDFAIFDKAALSVERICDTTANFLNLEESQHNLNELQAKEMFNFVKEYLI